MPTRSGHDYHEIHPDWFVCAYCYMAVRNVDFFRFAGMTSKRVCVQIDDEVVPLPEHTSVWTEPHCAPCDRRIRGYPVRAVYPRGFRY